MNLRGQHDWKMLVRWCRTDICSCKISAKVSLMLDNPFLVSSLCKLIHVSLCFIQISTKSAYSLQGKQCFSWSHPRCFEPLDKFQHNKDFYYDGPCFQTICFLWLWFGIQEDSIRLQLIYFLTTIAFWPMKYIFRILENCAVFIAQISHYGKFTVLHKSILIVLQLMKEIK